MATPFRLRVHRGGSHFSDRCTVECFIRYDGLVTGTVRSLCEASGFEPFEFHIPVDHVLRIRDFFEASESNPNGTTINVGYGEHGTPLRIKYFPVPLAADGESAAAKLWQEIESICGRAIRSVEESL